MKHTFKKIILLAFFTTISTVIFAQGTEWGVKTGLNMATQVPINHISSDNTRTGIYAGLFVDHTFNKFFGIQGEILYSMMGQVWKYRTVEYSTLGEEPGMGYPYSYYYYGQETTGTIKTDYIVLPVLAKLYVTKNLSLDLGPQFGYMVNSNFEGYSYDESYGDYKALYYNNKFDVSFGMGLSYKLGKFDVSGRCNLGLTKINKIGGAKNNVIQFGVGYRLK